MITVAGVTFSMTILSISHTTSQVGPRLLNNFMRDKGNQLTLGVFISTFLYCLMILRTVRNAETAGSSGEMLDAFVPHVAIAIGLLMTILSVGVLIYFIHHVPESIHISNIVAGVGRELEKRIETQFPSKIGHPHEEKSKRDSTAALPKSFYDDAKQLKSRKTGYLDYVDAESLLQIAAKNDLVIRLHVRAGDFVTPNSMLLLASPAERVTDEVGSQMQAAFVSGNQRTSTQNLRFVINQLVEVAMRALSPGVNDPFTAMNCMDWLRAGLERLVERELPDAHRYDEDRQLRLVAEPEDFASFAALVFDQLTPYVARDRNAAVHMMEMLAVIAAQTSVDSRRRELLKRGAALRKSCCQLLTGKEGINRLTDRYRSMIKTSRMIGSL
jgi:uncharacterized membrane protein